MRREIEMTRIVQTAAALVVAILGTAVLAAQFKTPPDWRVRMDTPGAVVETLDPKAAEIAFVAMPPGWHVTTGPGALLYHPEHAAKGNFAVETAIFLFPGESAEEYGLFLGGSRLGPSESPVYVAFVARRDGKGAVLQRGGPALVDWTSSDAILPQAGTTNAKNVLRVDAGPVDVVFTANGKEVAKLGRAGLAIDGAFGLRIGKGINVHASRLDITHRLAPVPVRK
jgi:hypothetical protein